MRRNWMMVIFAALLEVFWVIGLTHSYNFWTWAVTILLIVLSNIFMITAAQELPAGTVYAVFVGLGTAGTVMAGILFFGESFHWSKLIFIATLLAGILGLKIITPETTKKGVES